ncbi:RNA-directed DNA polymerase, eukaryota, reverse transcriptase zinc-binding domain protein [Tanacetum coccineum]
MCNIKWIRVLEFINAEQVSDLELSVQKRIKEAFGIVVPIKHLGQTVSHLAFIVGIGISLKETLLGLLNGSFTMVFHIASGLQINMKKSKLMGLGVDTLRVEHAIQQIGCMALKLPFKYLGSMVGGRMTRTNEWTEVVNAMVNRLSKWKLKTISIGVITAIHGEDGKIGKVMASSSSSVWLSIIREVNRLKDKGMDLISFIKPKCGNGTSISFWNSVWRGEVAFKDLVPRLYLLENMKDIPVASKQLMREGSGNFSVSFIRKRIDSAFHPRGDMKTRWIKEVPIKVNIHAWKVLNDYLPTRFNLSRRGLEIGSINCPICNCMAESARHLFFSCELVKQIMLTITRWWDLDYQDTNSCEEWSAWLLSIRLPSKQKKIFEEVDAL